MRLVVLLLSVQELPPLEKGWRLALALAMDSFSYEHVFEKEGPMGIDIESSDDGKDAYITKSAHAGIKPGSLLLAVNDESVIGLTFEEILDKVKKAPFPRKLSFSAKPRQAASETHAELPLPGDFFAGLPPLTEKEEAEIRAVLDSKLKEALRLGTASVEELGLQPVKEASGVSVHSKDVEGSKIRLVRAKTTVDIAADLFMYAALAPENESFKRIFTMLDPMFRDGQVLYRIPKAWTRYKPGKEHTAENVNLPFYSVKWMCIALPFPLNWRDFVFCELTTVTPDGYGVSLAVSLPWVTAKVKSLEQSHQLVRGNLVMSGYVWRDAPGSDPKKPMGDGHMMSEITYILQAEPKGILPEWVVNLTAAEQGMNCLRVVAYGNEQRRLVLRMYEQNPELNRVEVMKATVNKGESFSVVADADAPGKEIVIDWILEDNDVSFSIVAPSGEALVSVPKTAHNMAGKPFFGRYTTKEKGAHTITWDNSYSWFTSKLLYYHFLVI